MEAYKLSILFLYVNIVIGVTHINLYYLQQFQAVGFSFNLY